MKGVSQPSRWSHLWLAPPPPAPPSLREVSLGTHVLSAEQSLDPRTASSFLSAGTTPPLTERTAQWSRPGARAHILLLVGPQSPLPQSLRLFMICDSATRPVIWSLGSVG